MLSLGERVGRYTVESQIAVGGMAATYLCVLNGQSGFEKRVVVKMMRAEHSHDQRYLEMFLDEARLSARLAHPSIPQVFELGEHEGLPFMVMEFIDGPSMYRVNRELQKRKLERPMGWAIYPFHQVARALQYAAFGTDPGGQKLGTVHRDVTLANIMITRDGDAKLIDFGIAKAEARLHQTEVGTLKGSLQFMAPEALAGSKSVDTRADIFSLGVCMFTAITGRTPYPGDDAVSVLHMRVRGEHLEILDLRPDCPPELAKVVLKAMAQKPEDRYQQPSEMATDINNLLQTMPDMAWGPDRLSAWLSDVFPDGEKTWRPMGRQPSSLPTGTPITSQTSLAGQMTPTNHAPTGQIIPTATMPASLPGLQTSPGTPITTASPVVDRKSDRAMLPLMLTNIAVMMFLVVIGLVGLGWVMTRDNGSNAAGSQGVVDTQVTLTIKSSPPGAAVWEGNTQLGVTPLTLPQMLVEGDEPRNLELRYDGYHSLYIQQPYSAASVVQSLLLKPVEKEVAPAPAPAPAPKAAPTPRPRPRPKATPKPSPSSAPKIDLER